MTMKHEATCECAQCAGQSGADFDLQTADNIRKFGRSVICVPEGDGPNEPAFGYTVGNWQAGYPELLVIGPSAPAAAVLLNLLSDEMIFGLKRALHDGELFVPVGAFRGKPSSAATKRVRSILARRPMPGEMTTTR